MTWTKSRPSAPYERYGPAHRALRERYARQIELGEISCCRCRRILTPDDEWHLDHSQTPDADRFEDRYLGASHAHCNISAAAKKAARRAANSTKPRKSRAWWAERGFLDPPDWSRVWVRGWLPEEEERAIDERNAARRSSQK